MSIIYKSYIPKGIDEIMDHLGYMMLSSPAFVDPDFIGRNLDTAFSELNEGLRLIRDKLGEERYAKAMELSNQMRAHFEAAPENKTGDSIRGRELILEMEEVLKQRSSD
jgi:hypothetical protein